MILGDDDTGTDSHAATLDELFRRAGVRRPHALAVTDPPDRASFTDGAARQLTYADADRAVSVLAARLRALGLSTDAIVAIQLPNSVEGIVALLGVLRAGMIAAPMPLLWGQQDIVNALRGVGAKAIITCARAGRLSPAHSAMLAAAELFPIRHICAFGRDLPDGVLPLDDVFDDTASEPVNTSRGPGGGAHVAVLTFDVTAHGVAALPRNHAQLFAGAGAPYLEAGLAQDAVLLSTIPPTTFAGLSTGVVPWLMTGGTLALHSGSDLASLPAQCSTLGASTVVLPAAVASAARDAGLLDRSVEAVIALWRAPERMASCRPWQGGVPLIDVAAFGEIGLLAASRDAAGMPRPIPCGPIKAPRDSAGAINVADVTRYRAGTLAMRGPMVPIHASPPGADHRGELAPDAAGFVDTGFSCRWDGNALTVTAPPPNMTVMGGYRFAHAAYEADVAFIDPNATIVAVPDGLLGERLAGAAGEPRAVHAALQARGVNPLLSGAFLPRGDLDAA